MKKRLLTMMALLANVVLAAVAQETPAITFEAPAVERTITVGLNAAGTVKVDWGNGTPVEQTAAGAYDGYDNGLEFTGTPSGTVKIYGTDIVYFQAFTKIVDNAVSGGITAVNLDGAAATLTELDLHQNNLTSVDLGKLTALTKLTIGVNDFETIDLSANTELTTLEASATAAVAGKLTSLDLSKNTKLTTLKANYNSIESIDLSNNLSLKNIYLLNNGLKSIDFGENTTAKIYISLNNNSLETLDVTKLTGLSTGTLFLLNNNLTELKHGTVKTLNITGNKFDLASLYAVSQNVTNVTSANMQDMVIPETINKTIDLSSQAIINEKASSIVWKTASGTELVENTDYTVSAGVYTFIKEQAEQVYAELQNTDALPKLTTAIKTTKATVSLEEAAVPAITFEAPAVERTITVGLKAAGTVKVDWGNGTPVEQATSDPYSYGENNAEFTGTPSGTVKIYGTDIVYFQAFTKIVDNAVSGGITSVNLDGAAATLTELDLHQNNLTSVDLSKLTALTKLTIGVNDFETIDLSANTELTTIDANATATVAGKLTSLDLSKNTKLTTLKANYNSIESIDLSNNLSLKNIYLLNNGLTSVVFGTNTSLKPYVSLNNNQLESVDVTGFSDMANGSLLAMNNNLTEVKHNGIKTLNITGNKFDLASLYAVSQNVTNVTSASMQDMVIPETINKTIDLSSQAIINEKASSIVWKTASGTELVENTDYTVSAGVYTFIKEQAEQVYAELQNTDALPKLTTAIKTTKATVVASGTGIRTIAADKANGAWYNLKGQRVDVPSKGLYIHNGKKVVIK